MLKTDTQQQFIIDEFRPEDEADILAMNLVEYGTKHVVVTPDAFRWRYSQNPSGQTEITIIREEEEGHVVGFTWTIPIRMRLYCKDYMAVLTANQLIHPEYRTTLAFARMSRSRMKWLRQQGIPFRFNFPTETTFASMISTEKMSSFHIPLLVRPIDTVSLAQMRFKRRWLGLLLGWGAKLFSPMLFTSQSIIKKHNPLIIEQLDRFDGRFDAFWRRIQDKYAIMTVRDSSFLSWRFAPVDARVYRILVATEKEDLVGYVVLRVTDEIKDLPTGLVMDLLLEPGVRGKYAGQLLLEEAWKYFRREKVWLAGGLSLPHTDEYSALRRAGYRPLPEHIAPRIFRVAFNCFSEDLPETSQVNRSDLFFSIADYEAH